MEAAKNSAISLFDLFEKYNILFQYHPSRRGIFHSSELIQPPPPASIQMPMSLPAIVLEPVPERLPFEERTVENVFNTHGIKNADGTVLINMDGLVNLFDEKLTHVTNI